MKPRRLALCVPQAQKRIVIDRHVPEIRSGVSFHNREIAEENSSQIDQVHPLVDQLAAARKLGVRPPFPIVANAAALPVTCPHKHERTERAGIEDFARLEKGWMVAMVITNSHSHVMLFGKRFKLLQFFN